MASRLVYTAITAGHAQLTVRPDCPDTDFVCFSDVPIERSDWQIRPIMVPQGLSPRMQAKFHKLFPPAGYSWNIWIDGAYTLRDDVGARGFVDDLISCSPNGFGLHRHHARDCVYAEAAHSLTLPKCEGQCEIIVGQVNYYERAEHPRNWGLWGGGLLCRNDSSRVAKIMQRWWHEIRRWSWRDQISLPFVLRAMGSRPDDWPWSLFQNPYVETWKFNPA